MAGPVYKCDYADKRDQHGFCKYKQCRCDGNILLLFDDECEKVDKKDICKFGSIFGNYHIGLTDEQIEGLKNGEIYALLDEEYNIFIGRAEGNDCKVKECKNISDLHPVDEFHCSNCGLILENYTRKVIDEDDGDVYRYEYELKFCPECGLKVGE